MDRVLISKILGKKDSVDLDDQIYNLRDITEPLREIIVFNLPIDEELKTSTIRRLKAINNILIPIKEKLEDENSIQGFTNSKKFLAEFINDLSVNIEGLLGSFEPFDNKKFIYHSNFIMDLVLVY